MKIPERLAIQGFDWTVQESEIAADAGNCYGILVGQRLAIYLEPDAPPQKKAETLLHEILHACLWQSGMQYRIDQHQVIQGEEFLMALSPILYHVLKDNHLHFDEE